MPNNVDVLRHIREHCIDIIEAVDRFGDNYELFQNDKHYKNAVSMSILQIGELAGSLSEDYRLHTQGSIPWKQIRGMRNIIAHNYGAVTAKKIWDTICSDIPALKNFCDEQILMYEDLGQPTIQYENEDEWEP